jgi:hypothetical protein
MPLFILYSWLLSSDANILNAMEQSAAQLNAVAAKEGQAPGLPLYDNYALFNTPLGAMYGGNLAELQSIKATIDPNNVMGLTGGFKF